MRIIAIDPGTTRSAYVIYGEGIKEVGIFDNWDMAELLRVVDVKRLAIEMIASMGMILGQTSYETCVWIGRFIQAFSGSYSLVYRREVKREICGSPHAKDANIRQALIDKFGAPGTKKEPGRTYGFRKDIWAALAVAVTYEQMGYPTRKLLADDPKELEKWTKKQDDKREKRKKKRLAKEVAQNAGKE